MLVVLLVVIDLVFVGVIIVFVGVGVEQVGAIDAIAVGCSHETAISEVVILECGAVGGIRVFAHVVLFDGHAPPGLVGSFAATEG